MYEFLGVPGVEACGGFVQDVEEVDEVAVELAGHFYALGFAAGEGSHGSFEVEVAYSYVDELLEDVFGFPHDGFGYGVVYGFEVFEYVGKFPAADLVYARAVDFHVPGCGVDAGSLALGAGFIFEEAVVGVFLFFVGFVFAFLGHGVFEFAHEAFEVAVVGYCFL